MNAFVPQPPAINLSRELYYQFIYIAADLLPSLLDRSPAAHSTRNHAAIARTGGAPEAEGDRRRCERGRLGSACHRTLGPEGG
jgi:hypothetical protein